MARTIGKKNIALVKNLTKQMLVRRTDKLTGSTNYTGVDDEVISKLPEGMFDIWESSWQEIHGIIDDECTEYSHRKD